MSAPDEAGRRAFHGRDNLAAANKPYCCIYGSNQVEAKAAYNLWVTAAEMEAITGLASCAPTARSDPDTRSLLDHSGDPAPADAAGRDRRCRRPRTLPHTERSCSTARTVREIPRDRFGLRRCAGADTSDLSKRY